MYIVTSMIYDYVVQLHVPACTTLYMYKCIYHCVYKFVKRHKIICCSNTVIKLFLLIYISNSPIVIVQIKKNNYIKHVYILYYTSRHHLYPLTFRTNSKRDDRWLKLWY